MSFEKGYDVIEEKVVFKHSVFVDKYSISFKEPAGTVVYAFEDGILREDVTSIFFPKHVLKSICDEFLKHYYGGMDTRDEDVSYHQGRLMECVKDFIRETNIIEELLEKKSLKILIDEKKK